MLVLVILPEPTCRVPEPYRALSCARAQADALLLGLAAEDLPGVGPATKDKLDALGIRSVAHVRARSKAALQRELGGKTGASVRAHNIRNPIWKPAPCN